VQKADYRAGTARSYADIEAAARILRNRLGLPIDGVLPGVELFERLDEYVVTVGNKTIPITYEVGHLPAGVEAQAEFDPNADEMILKLSDETYKALTADVPRARFSLAHEVAHVVLHSTELVRLARLPHHQAAMLRGDYADLPAYRRVEWQANAFAGALLMPASELLQLENAGELSAIVVADRFQVSARCAEVRLEIYAKKRAELLAVSSKGGAKPS